MLTANTVSMWRHLFPNRRLNSDVKIATTGSVWSNHIIYRIAVLADNNNIIQLWCHIAYMTSRPYVMTLYYIWRQTLRNDIALHVTSRPYIMTLHCRWRKYAGIVRYFNVDHWLTCSCVLLLCDFHLVLFILLSQFPSICCNLYLKLHTYYTTVQCYYSGGSRISRRGWSTS